MKKFFLIFFLIVVFFSSCSSKGKENYDCLDADVTACDGNVECEKKLRLKENSLICNPKESKETYVCFPEMVKLQSKRTLTFVCE